MDTASDRKVSDHYEAPGLIEAIDAGLAELGIDPGSPTVEALGPVDEFHTIGRQATLQALAMMRLSPDMHVLDAGSGIGGTARWLAAEHGCRVTGIDLTPGYVEVARELTRRTGLHGRCAFQVASVMEPPFADRAFDAALSFHVAMNIADRSRFYAQMFRVLKTGAEFCTFDVMKGPVGSVPYPMPWAEREADSFLKTRDETAALLAEAGFVIVGERNLREAANAFYAAPTNRKGPPPLGLHLLTGANTREKFANVISAYLDHRTEPVILLARKP